jgi:hypothetical protein
MDTKPYFATLPSDEICSEIIKRVETYYSSLDDTGMLKKYRKAYAMNYGYTGSGYFNSSSDVGFGGEQGELALIKVNGFRNLIQHVLVMTTSSRPSLEARATNTDTKSLAQTILANGILDYYMRDKRLERYLKIATEHALIWGEGYVELQWNSDDGEQYGVDPETGRPVHEGDLNFRNPLGPLEVIKDIALTDSSLLDWYIVSQPMNKYDLAAKYPEKAEAILSSKNPLYLNSSYQTYMPMYGSDSPLIVTYRLYHKKTPAVADGREILIIDGKTWLYDGPLPHQNLPGGLPLYRISPSDFYGTPFGYTSAWDLIGIAEVIDSLYSTVTTNQTSFGVQNILVPKGHDIAYQQLTGGLNLIEYDPKLGKPESLNLTKTPQEIFGFIKTLEEVSRLLVGINNVTVGDPQASLKSGSALALVASQAIQFNSGLAASYAGLLEDVGSAIIKMLQNFANTKRVISIAGKSKFYMTKQFSSEDLSLVNRVVVDVANPLARTVAGRLELAQNLLQVPGLLKRPEQFLQVAETGKLEPMIEGEQAELMQIRSENEAMSEGGTPQAVFTDAHALHIQEHKVVLSTPDARQNPAIIQAVMTHIQQHVDLLRDTDPGLLQILGEQPLPPPPPPMPGMPGAPMPEAPPAPESGAPQRPEAPSAPEVVGQMPAIQDATNPITQQAGSVRQAEMPKNPLSGNKFNNQDGGAPK